VGNVALPTIGTDLRLDHASLPWVVTTHTLCFGDLRLGGRLGDVLGRRRLFLGGLGCSPSPATVASIPGEGIELRYRSGGS
jgi:MFS family permease